MDWNSGSYIKNGAVVTTISTVFNNTDTGSVQVKNGTLSIADDGWIASALTEIDGIYVRTGQRKQSFLGLMDTLRGTMGIEFDAPASRRTFGRLTSAAERFSPQGAAPSPRASVFTAREVAWSVDPTRLRQLDLGHLT